MEKKIKPFVGAKVRIKGDDVYYIVTEVGDETFLAKGGGIIKDLASLQRSTPTTFLMRMMRSWC